MTQETFEIDTNWIHIQYREEARFTETYGFSGGQGTVNCEGILMRPRGKSSKTLLIFMHPSSTLQLLPMPQEAAKLGAHVLCAASRYAKNDAALIFEKVLLDLGAYIRYAKEKLGYEKIVLVGWSGGGSLAVCYQAEAQRPTIEATPAGDPVDVKGANLIPADAVIFQAAHLSRAHLLLEMLDASVLDENRPEDREPSLDIYDKRNPNQPPYTAEFIDRYRKAQRDRMDRITYRVKQTLAELKRSNSGELERGFVVHRTLADPRFLDPAIDPNGRRSNWCYLGNPETVNTGPAGLARFSTLRSWLSQWSLDDSRGNGFEAVKRLRGPLLVIENSADDAVPQPHAGMLFEAATTKDKTMVVIEGATHYYAGQPGHLKAALDKIVEWLGNRGIPL